MAPVPSVVKALHGECSPGGLRLVASPGNGRVAHGSLLALVLCIGSGQFQQANAGEHIVPLVLSASHQERESFVRVINRSQEPIVKLNKVRIVATDDSGWQPPAVTLNLDGRGAVHLNSLDLEQGNTDKGLDGALGTPVEGDWRLQIDSILDLEVIGYIRTGDGMLSSMQDRVAGNPSRYRVPMFNPGKNINQVSRLRLVNPGSEEARITISGIDDNGASPGAAVRATIPGGAARTFSARDLESGSAAELDGGIGDGTGKWQLVVTSDRPLWVMSLLDSPTGHLTNLSTVAPDAGPVHRVNLFPPAADAHKEGFVRVINHGDTSGTVRINAFDDSDRDYEAVELALEANRTAHFNSTDLEDGNAEKGLPHGVGPGTGTWRLQLESDLDIEVLSYIRTQDGFLTSMHDLVPPAVSRHRVSTFNPARNDNQVSRLRLINPSEEPVDVTIRGIDGHGESPGDEVRLSLAAGAARTLTAQELESGEVDGLSGALGAGHGKWQLIVAATRPIELMSLLASPTGHLTNLSSRPPVSHIGPVSDRFEQYNTTLEPKPWWRESAPYSCQPAENADSPWLEAGMEDLGGSDPLSLIRYFGNGSYVRYGNMGFAGCTHMWKFPRAVYRDPPADPTYYTPGVDIAIDIARIPADSTSWNIEGRVDLSLKETVRLLNEHVTPYYRKLSEGQFRMSFEEGEDFEVPGDGSLRTMLERYREIKGHHCDDWPCSEYSSGASNRILFIDVEKQGGSAWEGSARIGLAHVRDANMKTIVHEIGHGWFYWAHSYAEVLWQPYRGNEFQNPHPYSNFFDFMSELKEKNGWRQSMPATLAINRYSAGWIPPDNVALHVTDSATYTLRKPYDGGFQFLVVHSKRPYAFTTLEVPDDRDPEYLEEHEAYDPHSPEEMRPFRYEGVIVNRYDQSTGTGTHARIGPAFYDKRNPIYYRDVGHGRDDHSLLVDGETRDIGGVDVTVARNADGSYDVTLSGGRYAEFETWCQPTRGLAEGFDTGCELDVPR